MESLSDWLNHLESLHPKGQGGIELGLERVGQVKAELDQRQICPVILVGGTNGKGSTCAYLETFYRSSGFRVGCYTSPHLLQYNERMRLNGAVVTDQALCAAFAKVEAARRAAGNVPLTYFEFGTLAAWEVFASWQAQVIILEVGLGGRLDAVNLYDADAAVITGIALDHIDWLGATREAIGFEKAGIFRPGRPAICADPQPPQSLLSHAVELGADLRRIGHDFGHLRDNDGWSFWSRSGIRWNGLPHPALRGAHQFDNAAAALAVVDVLQGSLPTVPMSLSPGLRQVQVMGRFQQVRDQPAIILDVAHNPQAVFALAENLKAMGSFHRTFAVVGMLADKDIQGSLSPLAGMIDSWFLATLDIPRGARGETLAAAVAENEALASPSGRIECLATPDEAFLRAVSLAEENDRILIFGSFHTVASVLRAMG